LGPERCALLRVDASTAPSLWKARALGYLSVERGFSSVTRAWRIVDSRLCHPELSASVRVVPLPVITEGCAPTGPTLVSCRCARSASHSKFRIERDSRHGRPSIDAPDVNSSATEERGTHVQINKRRTVVGVWLAVLVAVAVAGALLRIFPCAGTERVTHERE